MAFASVMMVFANVPPPSLGTPKDTWTRTQSRVWFGQHVLVLGWSEKTLNLIHELFEAYYASGQHQRVVVLADRDPAEMHQEIQQYFLQLWEHMSFFDRPNGAWLVCIREGSDRIRLNIEGQAN